EYQFDVKLESDEVAWLDCLAEWMGRSVNSVQFMIEEFESELCALAISFMKKLKFTQFMITSSQCFSTDGVRNGGDFFLGLHDFDWVPVFLEMFSRKVDKLLIINNRCKGYLPMDSSEELKQVCNLNQNLGAAF
ncbi:hypothetical protein PRIPAC_77980, partial [Pristionchus pacificus]|uniref:Uncharacterized protein n=1 Tax=Pristionchus pacificus TaxID=54126 RepID=A0A2A6BWW8_PRIPA